MRSSTNGPLEDSSFPYVRSSYNEDSEATGFLTIPEESMKEGRESPGDLKRSVYAKFSAYV